MPNLTFLGWLFLAWGVVTGILALILIYRSVIAMKEDDQLFLGSNEQRFEQEQQLLQSRLNRLNPYVKALAAASAGLLLWMVGLVTYRVAMAFYQESLNP
jgi:hypothetical protein